MQAGGGEWSGATWTRRLREGLWRVVENRRRPVAVARGHVSEPGRRVEWIRETSCQAWPDRKAMAEAVVRVQNSVRMSGGGGFPESLRGRSRSERTGVHVQSARVDGCQVHGDPGKQHDRDETKHATRVHVGSGWGSRDPGLDKRIPNPGITFSATSSAPARWRRRTTAATRRWSLRCPPSRGRPSGRRR